MAWLEDELRNIFKKYLILFFAKIVLFIYFLW